MWTLVQKRRIKQSVERTRAFSPRTSRSIEADESQKQEPASADTGIPPNHHDTILVECTSSSDPLDPRNWPLARRLTTLCILSLLVFTQAWAGSSSSLAHDKAAAQFNVCSVGMDFSTAAYLFGLGSGSLFTGPLSETGGRAPVYLVFSFAFLLFELGAALSKTFEGVVVCRYFVGLASSGALGINGASVGDMFNEVERTMWFPVLAWVNVIPPVIAPIVGGWVVNQPHLDWVWTEWITLIISAFAFLVAFLFLPETYLPVLLDWKAKSLREVSGKDIYASKHAETSSFFGRLQHNVPLAVRFATTEPAILALGGFLVLLYILLFSFLSGFDYIFKRTYALDPLQEGACFASILLGATTFTLTTPLFYRQTRRLTDHDLHAPINPEYRLWPAIATAPLLPISLFWLGWTNYSHISIYSGLAACFCFGVVLNAMYVASYQYIIDSYGEHAAIALSSITMMRYIIAGGMVMAARPMYDGIGVHWTMTLLGCVATLLVPGPYLLRRWGGKLREKSRSAKGGEA
ncbi:hypothetical protein HBH56_200290 [Parastagonospora nodorum]|uniref:Major facilitator superfamily (MFS) profile domain-containing protein n=1 Tax=Phaeosphaeria nodorum (strain SN15 / ATCC MYA-4574 / FGSC 10173) TaxID=321614 RepID=A0A7U2I2C9_PHANO|nr:hypothetical protein HBH56_200290 [Parastagonospora nodorum]QRD00771.1 hypothetical protein JI435_093050 [Parastagonospora nodorum SN15]KAH3925766.1 hypothetical protein HBH54_176010 [Parastagonospora nodorum]KAH3952872.1 hypothetical protein HBH53_037390 [Parastagonospora nodorum]KAH3984522.1 hypothetical protein HBH51_027530 [Parastagonospora nodorum]